MYLLQASEEYREQSTHKTHRARRSRQKQEQRVVEKQSLSVQGSSVSKEKFNVIRLNRIPLSLSSGNVTCEYSQLSLRVFQN